MINGVISKAFQTLRNHVSQCFRPHLCVANAAATGRFQRSKGDSTNIRGDWNAAAQHQLLLNEHHPVRDGNP